MTDTDPVPAAEHCDHGEGMSPAAGTGPEPSVSDEERAAQRAAWQKAVSAKNAVQRRGRARRKPPGITGVRVPAPKKDGAP